MSKYQVNHNENRQTKTNEESTDFNRDSYNQGYKDGRVVEYNQQAQKSRDNNSVFIGLLLGISFTVVIGLIVGISNSLSNNQESQTDEPSQTSEPSEELTTPEQPQQETTIIERTIERSQELVPVPQTSEPSPSESTTNVEIELPNPLNQENPNSQPSENQTQNPEPTSSGESTPNQNTTNESPSANTQ